MATYLTFKEASIKINKSVITLKRLRANDIKKEKKKHQGIDIYKIEYTTNKAKRVLILESYITSVYQQYQQYQSDTENQYHRDTDKVKLLEILKDQLKAKDNQLKDQADQIKEMHEEFQNFQKLEEKIIERYTQMQRSLEEKNEEIKRLQAVAVHRSTLLEAYTSKQTKDQDNERIKVNFQEVEEADQVDEEAEPGNINQDNERTFIDWITSTYEAK